jgi:aconitate hydratase
LTDTLINEDGEEVMLDAPTGDELPKNGFDAEDKGFQEPAADGRGVEVTVSETSDRLQLLAPFAPWDGKHWCNCLSKHLGNVPLITFLWLDHGCVSADI